MTDIDLNTRQGFQNRTDPAWALLITCLRESLGRGSQAEIEKIAQHMHTLEWESFNALAEQSGLAGLLYPVLKNVPFVPPPIKDHLRQAHSLNSVRNTILTDMLEEVLVLFARQGIEIILLKGAALTRTVYAYDTLRHMGDSDLLLKEGDVEKALGILLELGYKSANNYTLKSLKGLMLHTNELMLSRWGAVDSNLELHWHLFWFIYYRYHVNMDWFWRTAVPTGLGRANAFVLSPEAQLLHLSAHFYQHRGTVGYLEIRWLHDIAAVVNHYRNELDWDLLFSQARSFHLVLPLRDTITRVREEWALQLPPLAITGLGKLEPEQEEEKAVARLHQITSTNMRRYAWQSMMSLPTWVERGRFLWRQVLFLPPAFIQERYGVSSSRQLPIAYLRRFLAGVRETLR